MGGPVRPPYRHPEAYWRPRRCPGPHPEGRPL